MKFRTALPTPEFPFQIGYQDQVFGLGSCFVAHIKQKLDRYQFRNHINAFGTVFNPISIQNLLQKIENQEYITEKEIFYHQGVWKHFDFHSQFNHHTKEIILLEINHTILNSLAVLESSKLIILTLGTAWVYKHKKTQKIVNNCHKVSADNFEKVLLSPTDITDSLKESIRLIQLVNPKSKILLTLSPVRHLRDGFIENQRSKAHLLTAIHSVVDRQNIFYFPSYEILMDDLRDYRFYNYDLLHPNTMAVDYIWEIFSNSIIDKQALQTMQEVERINKSLMHKAFNPDSEMHQNHLKSVAERISNLQNKFPWMKF